ncbi:Protein of unknown function DUF58 [Ruminococcaceae bacterium YRB3002]|nr:Protein of unknown function DUF58 [Ruminococcaceae bacterium YRB3002]
MKSKSDYITRIKANISIYATKKTSNVLDGTYPSVFHGRSLNFEDLREYVPGDNIRDIDWKASGRSGQILIKRYVADKKHSIMLVLDTGAKMSGDTAEGEPKREIALRMAGTIGYIAYKNGDTVGSLYNKNGLVKLNPFRTGIPNLERILAEYDRDLEDDHRNDIEKSLDFIINNFKKRMIIFVITDMDGIHRISEPCLKRLKTRHDVLFVNISDLGLTGNKVFDVDGKGYVPNFISGNKKLARLEIQKRNEILTDNARKLLKFGISSVNCDREDEIVTKLIELLESHRYANIR